MTQVELKVSGMNCAHCVRAVTEALQSVSGVTVNDVRIGGAAVTIDAAAVKVGDVIDAVADAGYEAEEVTG
jgi:copper chaperone CopZ